MFKIFFKGTSVPKEILSFHRRSHESVLPKRVEFTRAVLITEKYGEIHVRPIYGILKANDLADEKVNSVYFTQLLTNITWPIVFFAFKWRFIAIIWIIVLLILIIYMTAIFYKKNKLAGLLQIPYIIWTIFATYLTIGVYVLNK